MTMLRFLAGDGCFLSFFAGTFFAGTFFTGTFSPERIEGVFSSEWARKKPAGGGKSGGLSLGCCRLALGCGSLVSSLNWPATVSVAGLKSMGR